MDDLIRRQDVIDYVLEHGFYCDTEADKEYTAELIRTEFPSVQKKGHWIDKEICFTCSECAHDSIEGGNFCSNCGSDMRGDEDG